MRAAQRKCPSCFHDDAKRIRFTAWGGVIGPRILSLVKCTGCGIHYNGKSGRRVEKAIRVYTTAALGILILIAACMIYVCFSESGTSKARPVKSAGSAAAVS